MARVQIITCVGSGAEAPHSRVPHSSLLPADGWFGVTGGEGRGVGRLGGDEIAACSTACLLSIARRHAGVDATDDLEALFDAPAVARPAPKVKRPRSPRKPAP
jgi:hypothetical protein